MVKAEHELAALKKQNDLFKEQTVRKENDLSLRIEQLQEQLQTSSGEIERLNRSVAERDEALHDPGQRAKNAEAELGGISARPDEIQVQYDAFRTETAEQRDFLLAQESTSKAEQDLNRQIRVLSDKNESLARELLEEQERSRRLQIDREAAVREEAIARENERDIRVKELETEAAGATGVVSGLETQLGLARNELQEAERKAETFAQELNRSRVELQRLRQQHEALQDVIKGQKTAVRLDRSASPADRQPGGMLVWLPWAAVALLVAVCAAAAIWMGSLRSRETDHKTRAAAGTEPAIASATKETPAVGVSKPMSWPAIHVGGVKVTISEAECEMIFEGGVFSYRATIALEAAEALSAVASQLQGSLGDFNLIIEGHTDTTPVTSKPSNNFKLGLDRAQAVLDFLEGRCHLPADSLVATSKGEADPPYPNSDESSRRRNRTVVLKLVPKEKK